MKNAVLIIIISLFGVLHTFSQERESSLYTSLDVSNRWIWRGLSINETPVVQPTIGIEKGRWGFEIWGSHPIEKGGYSEIDFNLLYKFSERFNIGLTDYFVVKNDSASPHNFVDFNRKTTSHLLDLIVNFTPVKKVPVNLMASVCFWGDDLIEENLKQNFSTYFELHWEKEFGPFTTTAFAGATVGNGFYAEKTSLINLGTGVSKELFSSEKISIPLKLEFIVNPKIKNAYLVATISLR